ncbi:MAG TPA: hypothetical protein GXX23_01555 [Firmicutes bacterium]|nr:hypothetical protein [Candidatus Fermentithermobacillaceae bacterium]
MELILKPSKTTCKGDVRSQTMAVDDISEVPEMIPCGNPDCVGGGIALRDGVNRALATPGRFARCRCKGKEKSGLPCWNIWDVTVR